MRVAGHFTVFGLAEDAFVQATGNGIVELIDIMS